MLHDGVETVSETGVIVDDARSVASNARGDDTEKKAETIQSKAVRDSSHKASKNLVSTV